MQKATVEGLAALTIVAEVSFQVCNDEMCLFPEYIPLTFKIPAGKNAASADEGGMPTEEQMVADGSEASKERTMSESDAIAAVNSPVDQ